MTRPSRLPGLVSALVYLFLYLPLAVLVVFSFNGGRLSLHWQGASLEWYRRLASDAQLLVALRNSLVVGTLTTLLATAAGTAAAVALHRYRFRRQAALESTLLLTIVVPEIVLASSLVLLFASLGLRLGLTTVVLAHVSFCLSYVVVVVRARLAALDPMLEEAAADLGASPARTLFTVTLPLLAPGIVAAGLLAFALSIDDYVVTSFVAGVGSTTLPLQIYSMLKSGVSPEINAVSTVLLVATSLLLYASFRLEQGRSLRSALPAAALALGVLGAPFLGGGVGGSHGDGRVLNLYIWSNYIGPETLRKFEERTGARVNVDVYDSIEALAAKMQSGNVDYDVICPTNYTVEVLAKQDLLLPLDRSALPHLQNADPHFLDQAFDPGNRVSVPYFWGTAGIAYRKSKVGAVDSWSALFDPRFKGRILMLDDARETLGAALKWKGGSYNTTDPARLRDAQRLLLQQKPLVRTYNSSNFEDVLLSGEVWLAQGWNGQFARAIEQDPDIEYVIPREGSSVFLDSLAIPLHAPHPELAHQFLDFTLEADVAAEICRTMKYSSPNRAALALLPASIQGNHAIFPPPDVLARTELINDMGAATVLYDRLWTEVKTAP
jgi:spermidine/putrescine transport system permease protein